MNEQGLVELFEERAAIREHLGGYSRHEAETLAIGDWRSMVGSKVKLPAVIKKSVDDATRALTQGADTIG